MPLPTENAQAIDREFTRLLTGKPQEKVTAGWAARIQSFDTDRFPLPKFLGGFLIEFV